jgi:hypothetical protein
MGLSWEFDCLDEPGINNFLEHEDNKKAANIQFITDFDNISEGIFGYSISDPQALSSYYL